MVLKSGGIPSSRMNCDNTFKANCKKKKRETNRFIRGFSQELHAIDTQEKLSVFGNLELPKCIVNRLPFIHI